MVCKNLSMKGMHKVQMCCRCIPSMENINVIFRRIWPYVQFNHTNTYLQCLDDGSITAVTAELITRQI